MPAPWPDLCEHDRRGEAMLSRSDPSLPDHVERRECPTCGAAGEVNTNSGAVVGQ